MSASTQLLVSKSFLDSLPSDLLIGPLNSAEEYRACIQENSRFVSEAASNFVV